MNFSAKKQRKSFLSLVAKFGMNLNAECEPDLIAQHQRWTSLTFGGKPETRSVEADKAAD